MGKIGIILTALTAAIAFQSYTVIKSKLGDTEFTQTIPDTYWGPKATEKEKGDKTITPFKINVNDKVITDLKRRLKEELDAGFTPPLEGIGFEYGFNTDYLKEVGNYWLNKYDWRSREKLLNQFPAFKTKINGLNIHFQHVKSQNNKKYKKTVPMLVLHGWPGSFVEHQNLIPLLTDPKDSDINFEVVVPSLPGYGFSDAARKPGLGPVEIGQLMVKLMARLGHDKFYVQGGDWGSVIGTYMATLSPNKVIGFHSNVCLSNHPKAWLRLIGASFFPSYFLSPFEIERFTPLSRHFEFWIRETGYLHIQATKSDTVGTGLTHSPTGLAAYILEKFSTWTNENGLYQRDGDLPKKIGMDEMLDNIMVYWITKSITTSQRLYSEFFGKRHFNLGLDTVPVKVPTGCIVPRNEGYLMQTESMIADTFHNLVSFNYATDGGHFFAMEHPDVLANDITPFVKTVEERRRKM